MPRIQYRAETFRCGWGAESAADRIFAGPSPWTMEAPVDCDRATIPAMASCEMDPAITMMEERTRAVAGIQSLRVIHPPADGKESGDTSSNKRTGDSDRRFALRKPPDSGNPAESGNPATSGKV